MWLGSGYYEHKEMDFRILVSSDLHWGQQRTSGTGRTLENSFLLREAGFFVRLRPSAE